MTFKKYVLHQLREMRRELLTALEDVPGEAMTSFEPVGHWPIAWIAEHCTEVAEKLLVVPVKGERLLSYEEQVADWPNREPKPGDTYPAKAEIESRWKQVCDEIVSFVEGLSDDDLQKSWGDNPYAQNILLAVNHTNSHLRSLWCELGQKRLDNKWAVQQNYLA